MRDIKYTHTEKRQRMQGILRERQTDRKTMRQRQTEKERDRDRQTETERSEGRAQKPETTYDDGGDVPVEDLGVAGRQAGEKWVHPRPTFRDFQKVVGHVTHCKHTAHTACDQRRISCLRNGMQRTESAQHTAFLVSAGLAGCQECNAHVQYSFLSHCSLFVGWLLNVQATC